MVRTMKPKAKPVFHGENSNPDAGGALSPAVTWVRPSGAVEMLYKEIDAELRRRRRRAKAGVITATLAVLLVAAGWQFRSVERPVSRPPSAPIVSVPFRRVLNDGSKVELTGSTRLAVEFSKAVRRVILSEGVAHFHVASNPSRPFVVVASGVEIRAVGTAFSVELSPHQVEVIVTEGRIAMNKLGEPPGSSVSESGSQALSAQQTVEV